MYDDYGRLSSPETYGTVIVINRGAFEMEVVETGTTVITLP